jgi:translation initiation factor IF-2
MSKRLIKIAKELNVGLSTIVDYLNDNGFEIENKPTAKVSPEMQDALTKEFQKSIAIREQANQIKIGRNAKESDTVLAPPPPKVNLTKEGVSLFKKSPVPEKAEVEAEKEVEGKEKEVITASRSTPTLSKPKILGNISLGDIGMRKKKVEPIKEEKKPAPKKVVEEKKAEPTVAKEEEPAPKPEVVATPKATAPEVPATPVSVAPPTPEVEAKKEEKVADKPAPAPPKEEQQPAQVVVQEVKTDKAEAMPDAAPTPKAQVPEAPAISATDENIENKTRDGVIRADAPELRGLKIKGKIDINKFARKPKKKDATKKPAEQKGSAAGNDADDKKKRRRKRKKVRAPGTSGGGQGAPSSGGGSGGGRSNDRRGGGGNQDNRRGGANRRSDQPTEVTQKEIDDKIRATMARISGTGKRKRQKIRRENRDRQREKQEQLEQEQETEVVQLTEFVTVSELASLLDIAVTDVITSCMNMGVIVSINQRLDAEIIELVAEEYNKEVEFISAEEQTDEEEEIIDDPEDLSPRAPIVTVMGHVDHGKTSLLDYIREAKVAAGEAGGITQHIGAYEVKVGAEDKRITFLDTPGHEAFTAMRARGAKVTDISIIIIAADDDIMPQTKEAISHSQAAGVPMIFAINKVDKPDANPERIKEQLAAMNLLVEDWGGTFQSQDISAKTGQGIDELLEKVILEAELLELQANPDRMAIGAILEASLDKGRGYVTKTLIQTGTLSIGDAIVAGEYSGKVKAMFNEHGKRVKRAGPSKPVLILGLDGAPQAGERFKELESETEARQIASKRAQINREQANRATKRISLDEIGRRLALGTFKELNLIVKGDFDGSIEALSDSLIKQSIETVQVNVIHKAVGQIIESDVLLASASDAIIVGFQVRPSANARKLAEREGVQIRTYSIIYEAINEIRSAIEGMLEPTQEERILGNAEVRNVFKISKVGTIAGCYVTDGKITRNSHVRIIRDGIVIYPTKENVKGEITSLRRIKEDVREVKSGLECGINVKNFNDIKPGDEIEAYEIVEVKQTLDSV